MSGLTRHHHQPINPFRTQPRADEIHGVILANPWLKACYVAAVITLMIAVLTVASTAVSQSLNPLETSEGVGPHQLTKDGIKTINGPSRRLGGGGVVSLSRLPPLPRSTVVPDIAISKAPEQLIRGPNALTSTNERVRENKEYGDDEYNELASMVRQQDEMEDTEDGLLQPGGAHLRIIGETKQQVKQEIERESYSEHAFGQQQGAAPVNEKLVDNNSTAGGAARDTSMLDVVDNEVHVVHRKGESREPAIALALKEAVELDAPANGSNSLESSPLLLQASRVVADGERGNASSTAIEPERSLRHSGLRPMVQIPVKDE
jgi:hypothetical protein